MTWHRQGLYTLHEKKKYVAWFKTSILLKLGFELHNNVTPGLCCNETMQPNESEPLPNQNNTTLLSEPLWNKSIGSSKFVPADYGVRGNMSLGRIQWDNFYIAIL